MKKFIAFLAIAISLQSFAADTTTVTIQLGETVKYATVRVVDATTGDIIPATVSGLTVVNNNPEVATVTNTTTSEVKVVRVADGSGTATVSCTVNYVDPGDGLKRVETKTIVVAYTVVGTPHGAKLSLTFN